MTHEIISHPTLDAGLRIHRRSGPLIRNIVFALIAVAVVCVAAWIVLGSGQIRWNVVADYLFSDVVLKGVRTTLVLTVVSFVGSLVLGTLLAAMRISRNPVLEAIASVYIWFFRGTPLLVQIVFWFNLGLFLPKIEIAGHAIATNSLINPTTAALLGLFLNVSAFMCEIIRGGLISVDPGQTEAALSIGMTPGHALMKIVLPQAVRVIIPTAGNLAIDLLKSTSLVYVIGTREILGTTQSIAAQTFYVIEMLMVASIWYLILVSIASLGQAWLEKRLARSASTKRRTVTTEK
ncbi:amino acid ABC transporter permease [Martelella sp. HB161492]|uniref:amino acid ABC transporter permease n=1 Tax=Martelella sp. HB161492 TaxID=2720726 RepID=UPI0015913B2D|nr:amino acid ABC transporter permease [Martelella sp. HB161492]